MVDYRCLQSSRVGVRRCEKGLKESTALLAGVVQDPGVTFDQKAGPERLQDALYLS